MAGDDFPTHAQRGGWIIDSGHRERVTGRRLRTRSALADTVELRPGRRGRSRAAMSFATGHA